MDREVVLAEWREQEPGQHGQVCRARGAEGSIRVKCSPCSSSCQLLYFFLPLFKIVTCQNKLLARMLQLGCLLQILAVIPVAQLCWVNLTHTHTHTQTHQQVAENAILAALKITNFDSLPLQKLLSMPHYAILQSPGTKRELTYIQSLSSKLLRHTFLSTAPSVMVILKRCSYSWPCAVPEMLCYYHQPVCVCVCA